MDPQRTISQWLGQTMKIVMSDGRTLVGQFLCTDGDRNVVLGSAHEHHSEDKLSDEPRMLGLAMVPGRYIASMQVDVIG